MRSLCRRVVDNMAIGTGNGNEVPSECQVTRFCNAFRPTRRNRVQPSLADWVPGRRSSGLALAR